MPGSIQLSRYIPFLKSLFPQKNPVIQKLSVDVWLDDIFIYLTIEDVICLRRVNKTLFLMTHEPIIWKRFLVRLPVPIPPLRPTLRWSLDLTGFQIEQLVAKAMIADDNWRRISPVFSWSRPEFAFYEVLELKLLPGGQYMVASVKDSASRRFYICIFCLDHPDPNFPPLARHSVPSRAFNIEARFLTWEDRPGIMIFYSMRLPEDGKLRGYDLSELSNNPNVEPPYPIRHESVSMFVDMTALEVLSDPSITRRSQAFRSRAAMLSQPFRKAMHFISDCPIEFPSLFEFDGRPFAALVSGPEEIVLINLATSQVSSIKCQRIPFFDYAEHKICAFRVLPKQNQVLVIRSLRLRKLERDHRYRPQDRHTMELHILPDAGQLGVMSLPEEYIMLDDGNVASVHISDSYEPLRGDDHPFLHDPNARPLPLAVYMCWEDLGGVEQINVHPLLSYDQRWYYNLDWNQTQATVKDPEHHVRVIPGVQRALMYTVPLDDRSDKPKIKTLGRYCNPYSHDVAYPHGFPPEGDFSVLRYRYVRPTKDYAPIKCSSNVFQHIAEKGCNAITWDESTGRVCMATQKNMKFLILDVRKIVAPDDRFAQWRRLQAMANNA
ncbi:hypothetical protein DFJ43DRAFT_648646 [Lentinula guzmanii]|uniref:F-box domain-containing protein n=2 Tax=Lentinula TaxID=5352 RepID=A0AA38MXG3_9AGAR|nr:hypothetical protein DFJ43DRAFT_648646 [Lentinula guzmanii]KAJ3786690.1 hypothetical protein GGU10DRAFT_165444 [Lentinula aff. detonsa]